MIRGVTAEVIPDDYYISVVADNGFPYFVPRMSRMSVEVLLSLES